MRLLYKKIVEAMWEVAENDPSVPFGPRADTQVEKRYLGPRPTSVSYRLSTKNS